MTTLYSKPGCQPCRMTKRLLESENIPHVVIDVTQTPEALEVVTGLGYQSLPVIVAGDQHWNGFRPDRVKALAA